MHIKLNEIKIREGMSFDGLLAEVGILAMKYCEEFECDHNSVPAETLVIKQTAGAIKELLELAVEQHNYCEDGWYSCPKAEDGCYNDAYEKDKCNCGADKQNERVAELKTILTQKDNKMNDRIELKGVIKFTEPTSTAIEFTNDYGEYVRLIMKDTLEIENTMPISEGAQKFIDWVKTYYDCEMERLKAENEFLKKELQGAKSN